jgi:signal transduction histidine kinase
MKTNDPQNEIPALKARIQYLENINRLTLDALDTAASLGDFQENISNLDDRFDILEEARVRVLKLLPLQATAFFLINESTSEFYMAVCTPEKFKDSVQKEVDNAIDNGTFAWAHRENRAVIVSTKNYKNRLVLHLITTVSRSRGMFVGILSGDEKDIPQVSLSLLSIVMQNTANAIESMELYGMIRKINVNLEKIVAQRTEELTYRLEFENLVANLSTTFINLPTDEIDNGIRSALETIGRFIGADHGFVLIRPEDIDQPKECFEWCKEDDRRVIAPAGDAALASEPLLMNCLEKAESLYISSVAELPAEDKNGSNLSDEQTIQALIRIPIATGGTAIGVLGFDAVSRKESWSKETASEIKIFGEVLINALERKWSEKERKALEIQLQHTHKMKGIGTLAAGVAHELNQPLMVIRTFAQMFLRKIGENSDYLEEIQMMEKNTGRMKNIIDHLRNFSRQTPSEMKSVDVNSMVEDAFLLMNEQLRQAGIEVEKDLGAELPEVMGSINQIEQVFVNLVTNAMDAIKENNGNASQGKGQNKDDTKNRVDGKVKIISRRADNSDMAVEILVSDNGRGIPEEAVSRVFDPFFTTKDVGKGTGLGLSISYGIMKEHNGDLEIVETGSAGSTFSMKLPVLPPSRLLS